MRFFNQTTADTQNMATIVGNIALPTTHLSMPCDCIQTCTSPVAPTSFFIGATASHVSTRWYLYGSAGSTFSTKKHAIKPGTSFFYQAGIGANLGNPFGVSAMALLEGNGIYTQKNTIDSQPNDHSGGNIFYIGPSLCFSGNRWLASGGIQAPAFQHLHGIQNKTHFRTALQILILF